MSMKVFIDTIYPTKSQESSSQAVDIGDAVECMKKLEHLMQIRLADATYLYIEQGVANGIERVIHVRLGDDDAPAEPMRLIAPQMAMAGGSPSGWQRG